MMQNKSIDAAANAPTKQRDTHNLLQVQQPPGFQVLSLPPNGMIGHLRDMHAPTPTANPNQPPDLASVRHRQPPRIRLLCSSTPAL